MGFRDHPAIALDSIRSALTGPDPLEGAHRALTVHGVRVDVPEDWKPLREVTYAAILTGATLTRLLAHEWGVDVTTALDRLEGMRRDATPDD